MSAPPMHSQRRPTTARQLRLVVDVVAAAVCAIGAVTVLADLRSPARPPIVLVGVVIGAGWALVGWINLPKDVAYVAAITVGVGVAVAIVASVVMVETAWWHPLGMVAGILVVAAVLNGLLVVRDGAARASR